MKIKIHPIFRIISIFFFMIIITFLSLISIRIVQKTLSIEFVKYSYERTSLIQFFTGIFAILFSMILTKGQIYRHGYKLPEKYYFIKIVTLIFLGELFLSLIQLFNTSNGKGHFASDWTLRQNIIGVWIVASISEELLTRGLIQSYLEPLKKYMIKIRNLTLTTPVIFSGVLFMLMHAGLISHGMNKFDYTIILISTLYVGLIAGYYREKSGSLIPAILVHAFANIFGMMIGWVM